MAGFAVMNYLSIAEGREAKGLRLVLSMGVPGPWSESAKAVLKLRNVPYAPIGQEPMGTNEELVAWTGIRNAPIAILDDEPPVCSWLDILLLAERLGSGPSLLPATCADRALCLGFITELAGPGGYGWQARLWMMAKFYGTETQPETSAHQRSMMQQYGVSTAAVTAAPARAADILQALAVQLRAQRERGNEFFIGTELSALDVYWTCFSQMVEPLPQPLCPMPDFVRAGYGNPPSEVKSALDRILIGHRDQIYERYIGLPLEF